MTQQLDRWSLVVAVNDESVLCHTLLRSPAIDERCQVIPKQNFRTAGEAYNAGLTEAQHEIVVFAHQDVYLPENWKDHLQNALTELSTKDANWGVLGLVGIAKHLGQPMGYCYSTGLSRPVGKPFQRSIEAESLDEIVLILRRSSSLSFDSKLPGFHLYGADICLEAERRGRSSYIIPAFCVHNSNGIKRFPLDFWRSYLYLRKKWWDRLPVSTCCTTITKSGIPAARALAIDVRDALLGGRHVGSRWTEDIHSLYRHILEKERMRDMGPLETSHPKRSISTGVKGKRW